MRLHRQRKESSPRPSGQSRPAGAPAPSRRQIRHAAWVAKWRAVDWTRQNVELAAETGLTHERIRQIRQILGVRRSPRHWRHRATAAVLEWVRNNAGKLRGLTAEEAREKYGLHIYPGSPLQKYLKTHRLLRDARCKHPWKQMNFALPNCELDRIWRLSRNLSASHRWLAGLPPGRWQITAGLDPLRKRGQLRAYLRAVKAEERKAERYYATAR